MSAHRVGWIFDKSNLVRSALASSSMEGRSLCVSMKGAWRKRVRARSRRAGETVGEGDACCRLRAARGRCRSPIPAMSPARSRKRRRDNKDVLQSGWREVYLNSVQGNLEGEELRRSTASAQSASGDGDPPGEPALDFARRYEAPGLEQVLWDI